MIDAAWVLGGGRVEGTNAGGYTTVDYVTGVGKGLTITTAEGDTGKTLFIPNAGVRYPPGGPSYQGTRGFIWSATQASVSHAYRLCFYSGATSGIMDPYNKLDVRSLRCVRS